MQHFKKIEYNFSYISSISKKKKKLKIFTTPSLNNSPTIEIKENCLKKKKHLLLPLR